MGNQDPLRTVWTWEFFWDSWTSIARGSHDCYLVDWPSVLQCYDPTSLKASLSCWACSTNIDSIKSCSDQAQAENQLLPRIGIVYTGNMIRIREFLVPCKRADGIFIVCQQGNVMEVHSFLRGADFLRSSVFCNNRCILYSASKERRADTPLKSHYRWLSQFRFFA